MSAGLPLSTLLSHVLVAFTIELDNEFERRFVQSGHKARVASLVMWSNFLRFVGDGIAVGELPTAAGLPKARLLSTLGGMERWRYVFVGPETADMPPQVKRDGWGSARGLRGDWVLRPTPAGRKAEEVWRPLFDDVEGRWEERFGADAVEDLRSSLRTIVAQLELELPEYLPIIGSANGMTADLSPPEREPPADVVSLHLSALLAQALLAYTLEFEQRSELSLPLCANFARVLDEKGVSVRDLPLLAGVSKEATAMALTFLTRSGYVVVDDGVVRLTPKGRSAQKGYDRLHAEVEQARFRAGDVRRLRSSLQRVLADPGFAQGLAPHSGGWRASKPYRERTNAVLEDPTGRLPHYPMVLHRGGWPDGS